MSGKKKKHMKGINTIKEDLSVQKDPCESNSTNDPDMETDNTDEMGELRKQLMDMPFEELQKLKEKVGVKMYRQAMFGDRKDKATEKKKFKRENKNRPMEMSSKKSVPLLKKASAPVKKKVNRDPRFDDLSGEYEEHFFKQAYSFLGDVKQRDKMKLLKKYKAEKDPEKKQQMESLITRMTQQEQAEGVKEMKQGREQQRKKAERQMVKEGKQPYFLKKSDKKKLDLAEKYRELKKSGKLEKYLQRKRKKNAAKERKRLPNRPN